MFFLNECDNVNSFNFNQTLRFLKAIKGDKYECYYKLIMTYQISRMELVFLKWEDIDFDNNTITIYPVRQNRNTKIYYEWECERKTNMGRVYPLLPNIKELLLSLEKKQIEESLTSANYKFINKEYIALKSDGERLNYNTLSRNLRYTCRDNKLPKILLSGLSSSLDDFICRTTEDYDYYRAWTRMDLKHRHLLNIYKELNLCENKKFIKKLNNLIENEMENEM